MRDNIKSDLVSAINYTNADGTYSDESYEEIQVLMDKLAALTPTPRPFDKQDFITDHWGRFTRSLDPVIRPENLLRMIICFILSLGQNFQNFLFGT